VPVKLHEKRLAALLAATLALGVAACGGDDKSSSATTTGAVTATSAATATSGAPTSAATVESLKVGYSAWPGWFPLAVADEKGIFAKHGLKVDLTYFVDYTTSLDALVAGKVDINAQTLNDTIFAVSSGSDQRVVVVGDNSTGNDAVICDKSITSVEGMKGKTVAAEAGVVDHFLLLQGLAAKGMSEKDIDFKGVKTDAAAGSFSGGQFDCVAVFAPFTVEALKRPGSHVVFSSAEFPGVIPDHYVATADAVKDKASAVQKFVDAWYETLDWIKANPDEATKIMAAKAELSVADYSSFAKGTTLFSVEDALKAFDDRAGDSTSLPEMARRTNPFLVSSGLAKTEADLSKLLDPSFTKAYASKK
jgi:NitT/TauT family transport system substrate-binding protein